MSDNQRINVDADQLLVRTVEQMISIVAPVIIYCCCVSELEFSCLGICNIGSTYIMYNVYCVLLVASAIYNLPLIFCI